MYGKSMRISKRPILFYLVSDHAVTLSLLALKQLRNFVLKITITFI